RRCLPAALPWAGLSVRRHGPPDRPARQAGGAGRMRPTLRKLACLAAFAATMAAAPTAHAANAVNAAAAGGTGQAVQIAVVLAVLAVIPAILISTTSFVRIVIVLAMVRHAFGMPQTPPNAVLTSLALFMTAFVMGPTLSQLNQDALQPLLSGK